MPVKMQPNPPWVGFRYVRVRSILVVALLLDTTMLLAALCYESSPSYSQSALHIFIVSKNAISKFDRQVVLKFAVQFNASSIPVISA